MKKVILTIFVAAVAYSQTSWDLSDHFGVATVAQHVELPRATDGCFASGSKRVMGPLGEVAYTQLRNCNLLIYQPARKASKKAWPVMAGYNDVGLQALASEKPPDGCWNSDQLNRLEVGDMVIPSIIGAGAVSTDLTAGNVYHVVAVDSSACTTGGIAGYFDLSATSGGSVISITSRGTYPWAFTRTGAIWDGGDGVRIHGTLADGDPVRFACAETCTLPTGLSEGTTYYLDLISTDIYDVHSNSTLTNKVNVTGAGSGVNEVISYWGYTLEDTASSSPAVTNPVVITEDANYYDITNGLTGVRIPKVNGSCDRAPIQGIRLADGTWTAAGNPNTLYYNTGTTYPPTTAATAFDSCVLRWDERSPLIVSGNILYIKGTETFYSAFEVRSNSRMLQFEGDWTTMNASGYLQLPAAIDTIRIRGMEPSNRDDTVETLVTTKDYRLGSWSVYDTATSDPQAVKYAHLYQAAGGSTTPLITLIGGWVDRMERTGCANVRHVTFETTHPATGGAGAFISYGINKNFSAACTNYDPTLRQRRRWGIHVDTKANLPGSVSTMSDAALHSFQIAYAPSLSDLLSPQYQPPTDPGSGWPCPFMTTAQCNDMKTDMRDADPSAYNTLHSSLESNGLDINGLVTITGLRANNASAARAYMPYILDYTRRSLEVMYLYQGNGTAASAGGSVDRAYYESFYEPILRLPGLMMALNDSSVSTYYKIEARRALGFWIGWAWDANYAPLEKWASMGDGMGLQNQLGQAFLARQIFSSYGRTHPYVSTRFGSAEAATRTETFPIWFNRYPSASASAVGDSPGVLHNGLNYFSASGTYLLNAYEAMLANGISLTSIENTLFSGHVQQQEATTSVPDMRFAASGVRTQIIMGDSTYDKSTMIGTVAKFTGDAGLKWLWETSLSKPAQSFFTAALVAYDWANVVTGAERTLVSRMMHKYAASFRTAYGTANESLVVHTHGPANDHMHVWQDGGIQIYALKAPLATFWNSHFSPNIYDRRIINCAVWLASEKDWTLDGSDPREGGSDILSTRFSGSVDPTTTLYFAGTYAFASAIQQARSGGPTWDQKVVMVVPNPAKPIIAVFNTFTGTGSGSNKIFTFTHHATGGFTCPVTGTCTPTVRDYTVSSTNFPSASAAVNLTQDALNTFAFTGAGWTNNASGVIDWGWYVIPGGTTPQYNYGNWCAPLQGSTAGTMYGANPKECQHIIKVNAAGSLSAMWTPRAKAGSEGTISSPASHTFRVVDGSATTNISATQYDFTDGTVTHLAALSTSSVTAHSMTLSGCPSELVNNGSGTITLKVTSTTACTDTVTLPVGTWYPDKPVGVSGSNFVVYHGGRAQPATQTYVFSTTPATIRTVAFQFNHGSATSVRMRLGSTTDWIATANLSGGAATITLQAPTGSHALSWEYIGGSGGQSGSRTLTVN